MTNFGSSAEPIGEGSRYFRVVMSVISDQYVFHGLGCIEEATGGKLTFRFVYLHTNIEVDSSDDQVRDDIHRANCHQDIWVIERNFLGHLHHHEDDDQVGTVL